MGQRLAEARGAGVFHVVVNRVVVPGEPGEEQEMRVGQGLRRAREHLPGLQLVVGHHASGTNDLPFNTTATARRQAPGARMSAVLSSGTMTNDARPLVVLCGKIHPDGRALLEREARVVLTEDLSEANVLALAVDAQGILFRGKPMCSERLMAACRKLKVVGRHGAGLDIVDIPAATRLGVAVVHAPGSNSQAVAEHALMLMLMCVKRAVEVDKGTRAGNWFARDDAVNTELGGKTLGIVGIGNVGRRVAKFTGALGMRVLAYDKYVPDDEVRRRGAEPVASLEALLPEVDVLTCHTPLTSETRAMINEQDARRS